MSTLGGLAAVLILSLSLFIKAENVNSLKFRDHYRCHCLFGDKACDDLTGECEGACDRGWFGPACQYKTCPFKGAPLWLTDDNDYTCNDESDQSLKVKLATRLAFTWLRIVVRFPEKLQKLKVQFQQEDNSTDIIECEGARNATVNAWTLDIHCEISQLVKSIIFTGEAVGSLCSLYVSKGRNMAKIKSTRVWQHQRLYNRNETDREKPGGQPDVRIRQCLHASESAHGIWILQFPELIHVYEVLIVNILECCGDRLKGFQLVLFDDNYRPFFHYNDKEQHALPVYTVVPDPRRLETISIIHILFTSEHSLGFCEMQVFGGKFNKTIRLIK
ncbi:fibrinogen-related molecule [Plakobranchus ocellatus]|uniref:Fibrinogen-related molecule n=1 Tax=Plakobranchus ocellatus TaxID=259542 RepID=A0AAV3ZLI4_9GAST|nr:fibrinogen-related molecule [Plakobranchus ocellatus]